MMSGRAFLLLLLALAGGAFSAGAAEISVPLKPVATVPELRRDAERELRENILPFWLELARDKEHGGFYGAIERDRKVNARAARGSLLTTRILWTFSAAYQRYHEPEYLAMARWAYDDLRKRFWDGKHGGFYWTTKPTGEPIDRRKIVYLQAFAVYALAEYSRASGERAALDKAIEVYQLVDQHAHDRKNGGYFEEFSEDWQLSRRRGRFGSPMGSAGQKSQNTHLHLLEAYTVLLQTWPDPQLRKDVAELTTVMLDRILDSATHHLRLFVEEDWRPASDEISFGHDIEFSWLLTEATDTLKDPALSARARAAAVKIADVTLQQGVDTDGGVLGEADPHGITDPNKEWWPQAEAVVGFLNAFEISGDARYAAASQRSWNYIQRFFVDRTHGEWITSVHRDGRPRATLKAGLWKCPYHDGRACLEVIRRIDELEKHASR